MKKLNILFVVAALVLPVAATAQTAIADANGVFTGVTAHRGNSVEFPENTLPSFQGGIDAGADWVELDIRTTKDGQIVISHDADTKRTTGVELLIPNATYQELERLDVAASFRKAKGLTLSQCPVQRMPLLKDALLLFMKQNRTHVSMHLKVDCVTEAIAIIKEAHAEQIVGFNDSGLDYVSKAKKLAPAIPIFWDRLPTTNIDEDIKVAKERGFETIVMHYSGVTQENVDKIKAANLKTGAWTVDDRPTFEKMLKLGIERIYTDDPKLLITIKKELN
ncbi:glycerophosphodiester phosphodiesterase family protein [Mucilaginibacter sp. SG564]|uniref:glycerophosphodiester phosphodiesterase n=1 Tax=Mucilaginibacter sp. SG564 TaxID=2587022 RepID=UPI001555ADDD|nr:glycerophosphodiester phosphodiesterase family protein [Mucilaginibacter sp. SG564]NOW96591.1 glycerophosphoryl diester phosphodiesterase [Mucilaginibacter sp. SG564]